MQCFFFYARPHVYNARKGRGEQGKMSLPDSIAHGKEICS